MEVPPPTEEMVAYACSSRAVDFRSAHCDGRRVSPGAFYLQFILASVKENQIERIKNVEAILVIMAGFVLLFCFTRQPVFLAVSLLTGIASLLSEHLAAKIVRAWFVLSHILGRISSTIMLTVIFFVILLPVSVLARTRGSIGIRLKDRPGGYWTERNKLYRKEDLEDPW